MFNWFEKGSNIKPAPMRRAILNTPEVGFLSVSEYDDDPEEEEARQLFWEGQKRLLTEEEFAKVIAKGYMNPREGPYQDDDRWNEWHAFLKLQEIFQLRENGKA